MALPATTTSTGQVQVRFFIKSAMSLGLNSLPEMINILVGVDGTFRIKSESREVVRGCAAEDSAVATCFIRSAVPAAAQFNGRSELRLMRIARRLCNCSRNAFRKAFNAFDRLWTSLLQLACLILFLQSRMPDLRYQRRVHNFSHSASSSRRRGSRSR